MDAFISNNSTDPEPHRPIRQNMRPIAPPYAFKYIGSDLPKPSPEVAVDAELFDRVTVEMRGIFRDKNNAYLSQFRREGITAILSWIRTKQARISSVLTGGTDDEGLTENFLDLAVYGALGALLSHYGERGQHEIGCRHLFRIADETGRGGSDINLHCVLCGETRAVVDAPGADQGAERKRSA
jgi:hypothetical protein